MKNGIRRPVNQFEVTEPPKTQVQKQRVVDVTFHTCQMCLLLSEIPTGRNHSSGLHQSGLVETLPAQTSSAT